MGLPNADSFSLSQAVAFVMQRCDCSEREAKKALQQAGRDGRLDAAGLIPLSAHPNAKVREAHRARTSESLRPADWGSQIDWDAGKVGPYFSVLITRLSIEAWLNGQTPSLAAEQHSQRARTKSSPAMERALSAIEELYPKGVPGQAVEPHGNLCRHVAEKLKQAGLPPVSNDTILRAAGRRK